MWTQECQDIVTQHCTKTHTQVHAAGHVVSPGYGKREAEPSYGGGYSRPVCQQSVARQCQKVPHQRERKVPRQVCSQVAVKVPYQVCGSSHVSVSKSHIGHGYGYGYGH